ncbi:carbon-nitrogen hydrolase family protein [Nocardioides zeae]|uniref:Carbon-nitrogen hydrolase family protein n=1 Tax=Nocardioides imazamoxiresistens TaxID=3231893 RepID=A0ABU3PUY4_9ACTN|nr:carbon-nitrogen hydrolase family protein [Nocardioides zeae]MDT9593026.1 carbon-nitrogen hydrolase family protein [Nocardioides zeae]
MKIALCQMLTTEDKAANLAEMRRLAEDAVGRGADLLVFPEFAMFELPQLTRAFVDAAEPLDGPFAGQVGQLAKELSATIVYGLVETSPDPDRAYNTLLVVGPDGERVAAYRKQHLYDAFGYQESAFICPGDLDAPQTFTVDGVEVGMLTCYDLRFPEPARRVVDAGAEVLLYPASWVPGPRKEFHWKTLLLARAIENTVFVAGVSQAPPMGVGSALAVDPMGSTIAELAEAVDVAVFDVDTSRIGVVRASNPSLANRRYTVGA